MTLTLQSGVTDAFLTAFIVSDELSERAQVTSAITAALEANPDGGWLDSHAVAAVVFSRRAAESSAASERQTTDYVQYMLRESSHVCRHADGHMYRVHAPVECSPVCDQHRVQRLATLTAHRESCTFCFCLIPICGHCDCQD